jgi:hypothetical protein
MAHKKIWLAVTTGIAKMVFAPDNFRYAIFSTQVLTLSAW